MKVIVFAHGNETAALARIRAQAHAAARRAMTVHPAAAKLVPATWNGQGSPPPGWSVPYGVENEPGNERVAIVVEDDFARGKPDFAGAADRLPDDWSRPGESGAAQAAGKKP
jgi:hypothetical protein